MDSIRYLIDFILHVDRHLEELCGAYGALIYLILFLIIFCETGFVVTPFLPGDSLLFAVGALAATGAIDVMTITLLLLVAAILGDTVNYSIGHWVGPGILAREKIPLIRKEHLEKTHRFFEKHGGKTIIIARFVPIVRTFAPFVAGIGAMTYRKFLAYNVIGAVVWVVGFIGLGYAFGNLPIVKKNFTIVIFAIIFISILPGIIEYVRARREARAARPVSGAAEEGA